MTAAPLASVPASRTAMEMGGGTVTHRSPSRAAARFYSVEGPAPQNEASPAGAVDVRTAPYALWLLRLVLGVVFLQHVLQIVFGYVPTDVSQFFGLPRSVSLFGLAWDSLIGLALVYGVWPRLAAFVGAATLIVAVIVSHGTASSAYGWQLPLLWIAALLAFGFAGDGAFTLFPSRFWKE